MPGNIFISYRRTGGDEHVAGRLHRELGLLLDPDRIFMDVDNIPFGVDFYEYIAEKVGSCEIFLAVIGPGWHAEAERLQKPDDFVRIEIETALARPDIKIVPLLIGDTEMPDWEGLPESLRPLGHRHGTRLTHEGFASTVERLARQIGGLGTTPETDLIPSSADPVHLDPPALKSRSTPPIWPWIVGAATAGVAAAALILYLPFGTAPETKEPKTVSSEESEADPYPNLSTFRDCKDCPEMIVIPQGSFQMGSPDDEEGKYEWEDPQREVAIPKFALAKTEVTFGQWQSCVDDGGCQLNPEPDDQGWGRGNWPVINVSWNDAQEYVAWLNTKVDGEPYRLPTEAEWEYAARAGTETPFSFGELISTDQANFDGRLPYGTDKTAIYREQTVEVEDLDAANAWGLRHMHGNVEEWVEDCWHVSYDGAPVDGSARTDGRCSQRVLRGGAWNSYPQFLRSANRSWSNPDTRHGGIGLRLARTLPPP